MARTLVLDDEALACGAIRRGLERGGHSVAEASTIAEARGLLSRESFDVLLCDVNLLGESGLGLVRQVIDELPDVAVVMVTGVDDPSVADEALEMGAYGYLVKPFGPNELLINVSMALRRRELERGRRSQLAEMEVKVTRRRGALQNALKNVEEAQESARLAERETVDRLVTALTLRSEETGAHIQRMSRYGALLAARRDIGWWTEDEFRIACMLHDVGKIGVPDAILLKPGKLTPEEYDVIKRHPELGATLLSDGQSRILVLGVLIAASHHERWDGRGYPGGLAGEEIPVEGRVAAVADAFDAMTSDRVYQSAMPLDRAFDILRAERAGQFDPELVDLFLASLDDVDAIRTNYADPPPPEVSIRVLIVDSRQMFADAVARLVDATDGLALVASVATVDEARAVARTRPVDVMVVDAELADGDGSAIRDLLAETPDVAGLMLQATDDARTRRRSLRSGCAGLVVRERVFEELTGAIVAVHGGDGLIPPTTAVAPPKGRGGRLGATSRPRRGPAEPSPGSLS